MEPLTTNVRRINSSDFLGRSDRWPPLWEWPRWEPYRWVGREEPLTLADVYQPDITALVASDLSEIIGVHSSTNELPTTEQFVGADPGFTGSLTTDEHLRWLRDD